MEEQLSPTDKIENIISECLLHSEDLIRAAKRLQSSENLPHISFHLALLALEEIGKASLIRAHLSVQRDKKSYAERISEDHVRKIFWALWSPTLGKEMPTKDQIKMLERLATNLHKKRLRGLYMPIDEEEIVLPRDAVEASEVENIISMAEARLKIEKCYKPKVLTDEDKKDVNWFLEATKDPESRRFIFSKRSMEKLVELEQSDKWMRWMRLEFEKAEEEAKSYLQMELARREPLEEESKKQKWKLKVRFHTGSHSIRPKALKWWNDTVNWIRLNPVGDKKELLAEFTLPKQVPLEGIWWAGWGMARRLITALNIGTLGYFWWYLPEQISRYYEKLEDLETKSEVRVDRSPILQIDWGKKEALSERDLRNVAICFSMLPGPNETRMHEPFNYYLTGLGFMSKTDVHMQFEINAFGEFYKSLKSAMILYDDWDQKELFKTAFKKIAEGIFTVDDEWEKYYTLGEQFSVPFPTPKGISLREVGDMKIICDAYFLKVFHKLTRERVKKE